MYSFFHQYADVYARYLEPFVGQEVRLAEVGILMGSGLAIWCDIFPGGDIRGYDIDPSIFWKNHPRLLELGAFEKNAPTVDALDQFQDNSEKLARVGKFDIVIDDGCHIGDAILSTLRSFLPSLNQRFVYFVEDNSTVHKRIQSTFPDLEVTCFDDMTVITRK